MKKQIVILMLVVLASLVRPVNAGSGAGSRVAPVCCPGCQVREPRCPVVRSGRPVSAYYYYCPGDDLAVRTQLVLSRMGYDVGNIDGEIGPLSRRAIRRYQAMSGLAVTGSINGSLIRSLGIR